MEPFYNTKVEYDCREKCCGIFISTNEQLQRRYKYLEINKFKTKFIIAIETPVDGFPRIGYVEVYGYKPIIS